MTTSFDYHPGIPALEARDLPNIIDVWCAQLGYWIQEDVVHSIVETNNHEWHFESRGDTVYTKPMLLAIGDKYESQIAAARAQDAAFR